MSKLHLIVTLAGERVAIPAAEVEAVVEIDSLTPVPRSPAHVGGLAALRSRVLTVIDCFASLELGSGIKEGPKEAIVVHAEGHPYALLVDTVEDVVEAQGGTRPIRTALGPGWRRVAIGMIEVDDDLLLLIDGQALLAGPAANAA